MKSTWDAQSGSPVTESELQAYVDGQLPAGDRVRIEAYLAVHPGEAERLAAYRKQNIGMHTLFDTAHEEPDLAELPPEMLGLARALDQRVQASNKRSVQIRRLVVAGILLLGAGVAGWVVRDRIDIISEITGPAGESSKQAVSPKE